MAGRQGAGGTTEMTRGFTGEESVTAAHLHSEGIDSGLWGSETGTQAYKEKQRQLTKKGNALLSAGVSQGAEEKAQGYGA